MSTSGHRPGPGGTGASPAFRPASWLPGPHLQTIGATLLPSPGPNRYHREVFELPDGDFVEIDWSGPPRGNRPLVLILHGLEGSSDSPYARRLALAAEALGWQAAVVHARGCGGTPNRLPRGYHAGETGDFGLLVDALVARGNDRVAAVGYSLGGNVLVKYLGERGEDAPLVGAAAVSVPYDLRASAAAVNRGLARLYRNRLLTQMKQRLRQGIESGRLERRWAAALEAPDFRTFDDLFTGPAHGFAGAEDYYERCSAGGFVSSVRRELLLVHALDDPFTTPTSLPRAEGLPPNVRLEVFPSGGHVGFICGGTPCRPRFWLERRITAFLSPLLEPSAGR